MNNNSGKIKRRKICLVSSCGGHFMELLQIIPAVKNCNYYVVTEYNIASKDTTERFEMHYFLKQQERRSIVFIYVFVYNMIKSLFIVLKERPTHILTTGAGAVFPTCIFGKLLGAKIIYIESFAKINSKSMTGRLLYKLVDRFYVQWEDMLTIYPKALYYGSVY